MGIVIVLIALAVAFVLVHHRSVKVDAAGSPEVGPAREPSLYHFSPTSHRRSWKGL